MTDINLEDKGNQEQTFIVQETNDAVFDEVRTSAPEAPAELPEDKQPEKKAKSSNLRWIFDLLMLAAVVTLFILHFADGKSSKKNAPPVKVAEVGTGEIVYINIDSINEKYELVHILTDSIDVEKQKQAVTFQNRQKSLEQKAANFERNYSSGSLTPQQAQYAQQSLQEESARLQNDYAQALESLEIRYQTALQTIADSLNAAAKRVNELHNASYIFSYQTGGQLLYSDPAHDITNEVLDELNKSFKKKK